MHALTPKDILNIYAQGMFPMAESADDPSFNIYEPIHRSILPIENLHVSRSLKKTILKNEFDVRVNTAFKDVIDGCATTRPDGTWINAPIQKLFCELHDLGHTHSVEAWKGGQLVGGLYGLQLGAAFCGESMFSRVTNASKVALVHLCARLQKAGFTLLDAQLENPHLAQFGQEIISQGDYLVRLNQARLVQSKFMEINDTESDLVASYLASRRS